MTRNGKIARLPRQIRELLNENIQNGEIGTEIVDWLNSEPQVQRVLKEHFSGRTINEQNLSEWKNGGYVEWLARQEFFAQARELADDAWALNEATSGHLADHLATVLAARYASVLATWNGQITEEFESTLRILRALGQDIAVLRRGEHTRARIEIEREKLEWKQMKEKQPTLGDMFGMWERSGNRTEVRGQRTEEKISRERAQKDAKAEGPHPKSEEIQPNQGESKQGIKATDEHRLDWHR